MATRKTGADPDDVIEGVAVEKDDIPADKAGKKPRADSPRGAGKQRPDQQETGGHSPDSRSSSRGSSGRRLLSRGLFVTLLMGGLIIALAGALYMLQSRNSQQDALQARLVEMEARIAALTTARDEDAVARQPLQDSQQALTLQAETLATQVAALAGRVDLLDGLSLPDAAMRLDAMAGRLGALEDQLQIPDNAPGGASVAQSDVTQSDVVLSDVTLVSDLILAQSGLATLAGMLADNAVGGDLQRWLPNLRALESAGLALGDLDALAAAAAVRPPSTMQLLAAGRDLAVSPAARTLQADDAAGMEDSARLDDADWWSSITSGLSAFVRIRDVGGKTGGDGDGDGEAVPSRLQDFRMALSAGQLARAVEISRSLDAGPQTDQQMDQWRDAAAARLHIDSALTAVTAQLTASLASSMKGLKDGQVANSNSGPGGTQAAQAEDQ
jgi:hypothetical protein